MIESIFKQAIPLLTAGLVAVLLYAGLFIRKHRATPDLDKNGTLEKAVAESIAIFLAGGSIVGGMKVIYFSYNDKTCSIAEVEQVYICVGGLAVALLSLIEVYKKIKAI